MSQASKEAVLRGAALLDREMPGWEARVDVGRLDLITTDRCVLGWVYGNHRRRWRRRGYVVGMTRLFGKVRRGDLAGLYGFDAPRYECWDGSQYFELEREWKALLAERELARV